MMMMMMMMMMVSMMMIIDDDDDDDGGGSAAAGDGDNPQAARTFPSLARPGMVVLILTTRCVPGVELMKPHLGRSGCDPSLFHTCKHRHAHQVTLDARYSGTHTRLPSMPGT